MRQGDDVDYTAVREEARRRKEEKERRMKEKVEFGVGKVGDVEFDAPKV